MITSCPSEFVGATANVAQAVVDDWLGLPKCVGGWCFAVEFVVSIAGGLSGDGVGAGEDIADFVVGGGGCLIEGIGAAGLAIEVVITIIGGAIEGIGGAEYIPDFVVYGVGGFILCVFDLGAPI